MNDEDFTEFLEGEGFAPALACTPVNQETLTRYEDILPNRLLGYWKKFGFCGYGEGLFWLVNPSDYEELVELWLKDTPLWGKENYYVIARTAFGDLYVWGDKCAGTLSITPYEHSILPQDLPKEPITKKQKERFLGIFISGMNKELADAYDKDEKLLFKKALKKLGTLEPDEMYGFVPAQALGGMADIKNVQKVKLQEHLSFLAQLEEPEIHATIGEVFGDDLHKY
jgi:hypothetical protein